MRIGVFQLSYGYLKGNYYLKLSIGRSGQKAVWKGKSHFLTIYMSKKTDRKDDENKDSNAYTDEYCVNAPLFPKPH